MFQPCADVWLPTLDCVVKKPPVPVRLLVRQHSCTLWGSSNWGAAKPQAGIQNVFPLPPPNLDIAWSLKLIPVVFHNSSVHNVLESSVTRQCQQCLYQSHPPTQAPHITLTMICTTWASREMTICSSVLGEHWREQLQDLFVDVNCTGTQYNSHQPTLSKLVTQETFCDLYWNQEGSVLLSPPR
jgi:hypothetical protein